LAERYLEKFLPKKEAPTPLNNFFQKFGFVQL